jgi:hypothetical protein
VGDTSQSPVRWSAAPAWPPAQALTRCVVGSFAAAGSKHTAALCVLPLSSAGAAGWLASRGGPPASVTVLGAGEGHDPVALPSGVWVRRMRWHPASEAHLTVLLSDGRMHLYGVPPVPLAEMESSVASRLARRLVREQELVLCGHGLSAGDPPVDFTFLPPGSAGWDATAVLVLQRDGSLGVVCPGPMPFGGHVSATTAALMHAHEPRTADTDAWLTAALPSWQAQDGTGNASLGGSRCVAIAPHAVTGRAPALVGPLPQLNGDADAAGQPSEAMALAVAALPGGPGGAAALLSAVVSRDGTLALSLILDSCLESREALFSPSFGEAGTSVDRDLAGVPRATRALVPHHRPPTDDEEEEDELPLPVVLLVDIVSTGVLPAPSPGGLACAVAWEPPPGRRLFVSAGARVCCVSLTWLPLVPRLLADAAGGGRAGQDAGPTSLPLPVVELLRDGNGGSLLAGAALRRDVLCPATLLTLEAPDGRLAVCEPAPVVQATDASGEGRTGRPQEGDNDGGAAALEALVGGPPRRQAQPALPADVAMRTAQADSSGGASAVATGASTLRELYLPWAHRAHAELGRRTVRLGTEGARQLASLQQLQKRSQQLAARNAELHARTEAAHALHANLSARAALLAELARELPRNSAAEHTLAAQLRAWADMLPALEGRVDAAKQRASQPLPSGDEAAQRMRSRAQAALPAAHMRRLQDALAVSAAQLASTVAKVRDLQLATDKQPAAIP